MDLDEWWPRLSRPAQEWLIANNGDALPADMVEQISAAGGAVTSDACWVGERQPDGLFLSDEATDWIEAVANGEAPGVP